MCIFETLLIEEDAQTLWGAEVDGLKLWPFLRTRAYHSFLQRQNQYEAAHKFRHLARLSPAVWSKHWLTLRIALKPCKQGNSVLFYVSARPSAAAISRSYYEVIPRALVIETTWNGQSTPNQAGDSRTYILEDTFLLWATLYGRAARLKRAEQQMLMDYATHVCQVFDLADLQQNFYKHLVNSIKIARPLRWLFARALLPRVAEKTAFVQNASYMDRYSVIVKLLHEGGFCVAEIQHGTVYETHPAYNYSPALLDDPNHPGRAYLPDVLLGFGTYWFERIRIPARCVAVGLPHLTESAREIERRTVVRPGQILIISQGIVTSKMVEITERLSRALPRSRIVFKLHPGEVPFRSRYQSLETLPNVVVIGEANIHPLIAESEVIVGATSTALYEARAFSCKRIFVLANDQVPMSLGQQFSNPDELIGAIEKPDVGYSALPGEIFWAQDWRANLQTFLKEYLPAIDFLAETPR